MNVSFILLIILFILMTVIGGGRGLKSFFTLFLNFIMLFVMLTLISINLDPIKVTIVICIIISFITLFFINGFNIKTISSLLSVTLVVFITMLITYNIGNSAKIQGFGNEQAEAISYLSLYVQLNFGKIVICEMLIGLLGAVIDVSISISSSMYEIYKSSTFVTRHTIFISGMNIGKDILGTMTNTLLFAYISSFMTLLIYFSETHYTIISILNTKVFCSDVFQSLCSGIGIILVIPITAFITSQILFLKLPFDQDNAH